MVLIYILYFINSYIRWMINCDLLKLLLVWNFYNKYFLVQQNKVFRWLIRKGRWLIRLRNAFFPPDPQPPIIKNLYGWLRIIGQFGVFSFNFFSCDIIKVIHFVLYFILLQLISSFLHTRSLLVLHAYVCVESSNSILLL